MDAGTVKGIEVAGRDVYWTDFGDGLEGRVMRGSLDGTAPFVLASKQKQPRVIVADEHDVRWNNQGNKRPRYFLDGSVVRMPRAGGKKRWVIAKEQSLPFGFALDAEAIYWTTSAS